MESNNNQTTSCCPAISWGKLLEESSDSSCPPPPLLGKELFLGGAEGEAATPIPVYYSAPSSSNSSTADEDSKKKAIIIIPDVWGPSDRLRRLADTFSSTRGYHVILPDPFRGETVDCHPNFVEWASKFTFEDVIQKDLDAILNYLETEIHIAPCDTSIIGFCWGGWVIAKSASEGYPWKCGVSLHPSTKIESFVFQRDETAMLEKVTMPFLLLPAGNDEAILKPGSAIVDKFRERGGDSIVFERMVHGWVSRGDMEQPYVKEDIEKALDLTMKFIDKHYH